MHTTAATALRALLAERRAETEAVLGLVRRIASSLDVDEILSETVSLAAELTGCAGALVYVLDEEAGRLTVRAGRTGLRAVHRPLLARARHRPHRLDRAQPHAGGDPREPA